MQPRHPWQMITPHNELSEEELAIRQTKLNTNGGPKFDDFPLPNNLKDCIFLRKPIVPEVLLDDWLEKSLHCPL